MLNNWNCSQIKACWFLIYCSNQSWRWLTVFTFLFKLVKPGLHYPAHLLELNPYNIYIVHQRISLDIDRTRACHFSAPSCFLNLRPFFIWSFFITLFFMLLQWRGSRRTWLILVLARNSSLWWTIYWHSLHFLLISVQLVHSGSQTHFGKKYTIFDVVIISCRIIHQSNLPNNQSYQTYGLITSNRLHSNYEE